MALQEPPECPLAPTEGLLPLNKSSLQMSLTCWRSAEHFCSSARLWLLETTASCLQKLSATLLPRMLSISALRDPQTQPQGS